MDRPGMTLEQLRIFVAVAEREHMTRAADALGLTQSAVSAAIAALEASYATPLFHRVGRRIELTDGGRMFLGEARGVLARARAAELALAELGGLRRGTLSVHASQTIASYWLPGRLVAFRRTYPEVAVRMAIGNTAEVAHAVLEGTAELGFVEGTVDVAALAVEPVGQDRLVLVVAPRHPWAGGDRLAPEALPNSAWVLREVGSGTRSAFEAALAALGLAIGQLPIALELPSNEAVRHAVEAGAGATVTSELVAAAGLRSGTLVQVPIALPERPFFVLRHRERYFSRAARALLELAYAGDPPTGG